MGAVGAGEEEEGGWAWENSLQKISAIIVVLVVGEEVGVVGGQEEEMDIEALDREVTKVECDHATIIVYHTCTLKSDSLMCITILFSTSHRHVLLPLSEVLNKIKMDITHQTAKWLRSHTNKNNYYTLCQNIDMYLYQIDNGSIDPNGIITNLQNYLHIIIWKCLGLGRKSP